MRLQKNWPMTMLIQIHDLVGMGSNGAKLSSYKTPVKFL